MSYFYGQIPNYESSPFFIDENHENILERKVISNFTGTGKFAVDFGGGYGRLTDLLVENYKYVFLVDYSLKNLRNAMIRLKGSNIIYVAADIRKPIFIDGVVDFGMSIRVIHHYDDLFFIRNFMNSIGKGGKFVLNFNNIRSPLLLIGLIRRLFFSDNSYPNPLKRRTQRISVESGLRDIYFTEIDEIIKNTPDFMRVSQIFGCGLFHNSLFESISGSFNLDRVIKAELFLGNIKIFTSLFPDIFISFDRAEGNFDNKYEPTEILRCSRCSGPLTYNSDALSCNHCGSYFKILDGIIDLRTALSI